MQDVSFFIIESNKSVWIPVIDEIKKAGHKIVYEPVDSEFTIVLSGTYSNPLAVKGNKILIAHTKEWGNLWPVLYKPVLEEYYDQVIAIDAIPLDRLMDKIGGIIETAKSRSKD